MGKMEKEKRRKRGRIRKVVGSHFNAEKKLGSSNHSLPTLSKGRLSRQII